MFISRRHVEQIERHIDYHREDHHKLQDEVWKLQYKLLKLEEFLNVQYVETQPVEPHYEEKE